MSLTRNVVYGGSDSAEDIADLNEDKVGVKSEDASAVAQQGKQDDAEANLTPQADQVSEQSLKTDATDTINQEEIPEKPEIPTQKQEEKSEDDSLSEEKVLEFIKTKTGKDVKSVEDFISAPKAVEDPLVGLDDETKDFLAFKRETGRGWSDWEALNKDYSGLSNLELAKLSIQEQTKIKLSDTQLDELLANKIGLDPDEEEGFDKLNIVQQVAIEKLGKEYVSQKESEKIKYKKAQVADDTKPLENKVETSQIKNEEDSVLLEDGRVLKKEEYDTLIKQREEYVKGNKAAVDSVTASAYEFTFKEQGVENTYEVSYDYTPEDKHRMLSLTQDLSKTVQEKYGTENGFDYQSLNEDMLWFDRESREKMLHALLSNGRSSALANYIERRDNIPNSDFVQSRMPVKEEEGKIKSNINGSVFGLKRQIG